MRPVCELSRRQNADNIPSTSFACNTFQSTEMSNDTDQNATLGRLCDDTTCGKSLNWFVLYTCLRHSLQLIGRNCNSTQLMDIWSFIYRCEFSHPGNFPSNIFRSTISICVKRVRTTATLIAVARHFPTGRNLYPYIYRFRVFSRMTISMHFSPKPTTCPNVYPPNTGFAGMPQWRRATLSWGGRYQYPPILYTTHCR